MAGFGHRLLSIATSLLAFEAVAQYVSGARKAQATPSTAFKEIVIFKNCCFFSYSLGWLQVLGMGK